MPASGSTIYDADEDAFYQADLERAIAASLEPDYIGSQDADDNRWPSEQAHGAREVDYESQLQAALRASLQSVAEDRQRRCGREVDSRHSRREADTATYGLAMPQQHQPAAWPSQPGSTWLVHGNVSTDTMASVPAPRPTASCADAPCSTGSPLGPGDAGYPDGRDPMTSGWVGQPGGVSWSSPFAVAAAAASPSLDALPGAPCGDAIASGLLAPSTAPLRGTSAPLPSAVCAFRPDGLDPLGSEGSDSNSDAAPCCMPEAGARNPACSLRSHALLSPADDMALSSSPGKHARAPSYGGVEPQPHTKRSRPASEDGTALQPALSAPAGGGAGPGHALAPGRPTCVSERVGRQASGPDRADLAPEHPAAAAAASPALVLGLGRRPQVLPLAGDRGHGPVGAPQERVEQHSRAGGAAPAPAAAAEALAAWPPQQQDFQLPTYQRHAPPQLHVHEAEAGGPLLQPLGGPALCDAPMAEWTSSQDGSAASDMQLDPETSLVDFHHPSLAAPPSAADRRMRPQQRVWWWLGPGQARQGRITAVDRRSDPLLYTVRLDDSDSVMATADCLLPYVEYGERLMCRLPLDEPQAAGHASASCAWAVGWLQYCLFEGSAPMVHVHVGPAALPYTLPYDHVTPVADAAEGCGAGCSGGGGAVGGAQEGADGSGNTCRALVVV